MYKKGVIKTEIDLNGLEPKVREDIEELIVERSKYHEKYLKWKSRYVELELRYNQLQKMYIENIKELQKHVGY